VMTVGDNHELFLSALKSIVLSEAVKVEVVIVWDGQQKQPIPEAIKDFGVTIKHVESPKRIGPYACRNLALPICEYDFIAFQDADDWSHPLRLALQVALIEEESVQSCTVSQLRFFANGCPDLENNGHFMGDGPVTLVLRRSVLAELGGFDFVRTRGDIEFIRRLHAYYGKEGCQHYRLPLLFASSSPTTNSRAFADSDIARYRRQMKVWHEEIKRGKSPFLNPLHPSNRQFIAPSKLLIEIDR